MTKNDEWGRDPAVKMMRKVFKNMETAQKELLHRLDISQYDLRIRRWRERSLSNFERAWGLSNSMGIIMNEKKASDVYIRCLAREISSEGTVIPADALPIDKDIEKLLREVGV